MKISKRPSEKKRTCLSTVMLFLFLCTFIACAVGDDDDDSSNNDNNTPITLDPGSTFSLTGVTNDSGVAEVSFNVAEGTTKFSITAQLLNSGDSVRLSQVENNRGVNYLFVDGPSVSLADVFSPSVKSFSVPSRNLDPQIENGDTFFVAAGSSNASAGQEVTFTINSQGDGDLNNGNVIVNLFFVGEIGQDSANISAVQQSLNTASNTFSSEAGIGISFNEVSIDGPVNLPSPANGDSFYSQASSSVSPLSINVFIGGDINIGGAGVSGTVLGFASDIPGPPISSERSSVAVSIFAGAGPDGIFEGEDIRLLGETIAHEVGHFMGLFHPIDFSGNSVAFVDPLTDTDTCATVSSCLSNSNLTNNLMYPSPVADGSGNFIAQNQLSDQQRGVLNRYIAVD